MAAPTLVGTPDVQFFDTTTQTTCTSGSLTVQTGDIIVIKHVSADPAGYTVTGCSFGGSAATLRASQASGSYCGLWVYTYTVPSGSTATVTSTRTYGGAPHSMVTEVWRGATLAATPATNTTKTWTAGTGFSASLTTVGTNSIVSWCAGDWAAVAFGTIGWLSSATTDGATSNRGGDGSTYSSYYAYQSAATAGTQTFGLSTPAASTFSAVGIELQGTGGAPPTSGSDTAAVTASLSAAGTQTGLLPIMLREAGAALSGTVAVTAINPAVPASATTGDMSILAAGGKPYGITITDPANWTPLTSASNGTVANSGADLGSTYVEAWARESAPTGAIGALTIGGTPNSCNGLVMTYSKDSTCTWDVTSYTTGGDTSNGANFSANGTTGLDVAAGDWVVAICQVNGDVASGGITNIAIGGMAGATLGTTQLRRSAAVTTGYDNRLIMADVSVDSGTSNAAPTFTYTNASSGSGTVIWVRLRQVSPVTDFTGPSITTAVTATVTSGGIADHSRTSTAADITATTTAAGGGTGGVTTVAVTDTLTTVGGVSWSGPSTAIAVTATRATAGAGTGGTATPVTAALPSVGAVTWTGPSTAVAVTAGVTAAGTKDVGERSSASTPAAVTDVTSAGGAANLSGVSTATAVTAARGAAGGTATSAATAVTASLPAAGSANLSRAATTTTATAAPSGDGDLATASVSTATAVTATRPAGGVGQRTSTSAACPVAVTAATGGSVNVSSPATDLAITGTHTAIGGFGYTGSSTPTAVTAYRKAHGPLCEIDVTLTASGSTATFYYGATTATAVAVTLTAGGVAALNSGSAATAVTAARTGNGIADRPGASTPITVTASAPVVGATNLTGDSDQTTATISPGIYLDSYVDLYDDSGLTSGVASGDFGAPLAVTAASDGDGLSAGSSPSTSVVVVVARPAAGGATGASTVLAGTATTPATGITNLGVLSTPLPAVATRVAAGTASGSSTVAAVVATVGSDGHIPVGGYSTATAVAATVTAGGIAGYSAPSSTLAVTGTPTAATQSTGASTTTQGTAARLAQGAVSWTCPSSIPTATVTTTGGGVSAGTGVAPRPITATGTAAGVCPVTGTSNPVPTYATTTAAAELTGLIGDGTLSVTATTPTTGSADRTAGASLPVTAFARADSGSDFTSTSTTTAGTATTSGAGARGIVGDGVAAITATAIAGGSAAGGGALAGVVTPAASGGVTWSGPSTAVPVTAVDTGTGLSPKLSDSTTRVTTATLAAAGLGAGGVSNVPLAVAATTVAAGEITGSTSVPVPVAATLPAMGNVARTGAVALPVTATLAASSHGEMSSTATTLVTVTVTGDGPVGHAASGMPLSAAITVTTDGIGDRSPDARPVQVTVSVAAGGFTDIARASGHLGVFADATVSGGGAAGATDLPPTALFTTTAEGFVTPGLTGEALLPGTALTGGRLGLGYSGSGDPPGVLVTVTGTGSLGLIPITFTVAGPYRQRFTVTGPVRVDSPVWSTP